MGILGGGVAACFLKSSPNFRPKNVIFHTRFQIRPLKSMPVFRPGLLIGTNYVIITWPLEHKQKIIQIHFRMFSLSSYSFGNETLNTFTHSVVPSKTIPDSRPKTAKCMPIFRPKRRKNPSRWGGIYLYGLYNEVPLTSHRPPPPLYHLCYSYPPSPTPPLPFTTCATNIVSKGAVISKANTFFASIENFFRID